MIAAVRLRIKEIGDLPNQAVARILFELTDEKDAFIGNEEDNENVFETLVME